MPESIDQQAARTVAISVAHGADSPEAAEARDQMLMDHGLVNTEQALARVTQRAQG